MIGLFFEVEIKSGHRQQYLDHAAALKPDLEAIGSMWVRDRAFCCELIRMEELCE